MMTGCLIVNIKLKKFKIIELVTIPNMMFTIINTFSFYNYQFQQNKFKNFLINEVSDVH